MKSSPVRVVRGIRVVRVPVFIGCGAAPGMAICSENVPIVLERGLLTERSPGGLETALSINVDADTGVFIGRVGGRGMPSAPKIGAQDSLPRSSYILQTNFGHTLTDITGESER